MKQNAIGGAGRWYLGTKLELCTELIVFLCFLGRRNFRDLQQLRSTWKCWELLVLKCLSASQVSHIANYGISALSFVVNPGDNTQHQQRCRHVGWKWWTNRNLLNGPFQTFYIFILHEWCALKTMFVLLFCHNEIISLKELKKSPCQQMKPPWGGGFGTSPGRSPCPHTPGWMEMVTPRRCPHLVLQVHYPDWLRALGFKWACLEMWLAPVIFHFII